MTRGSAVLGAALCVLVAALSAPPPSAAAPATGLAMHGEPRHAAGFTHFSYVNPDAPKGGEITYARVGTFDSTNPLIVRGVAAAGVRDHVFESLMTRGLDEPFTLYGLLAQSVETPADRSSVTFRLRPQARFSDGQPVVAEDVVFSFETLRDHGRPNYRGYYDKVARVEVADRHTVRFVFGEQADRELPLILGLMPILPRHHYRSASFERTTLEPPLGSGPYVVSGVDAGASITYSRDGDYWGRDLPVNVGRHNFDRITYEYYRDQNAAFEAFKKGIVDVRFEDDPSRWAGGYDFPALARGEVVLEEAATGLPSGMNALVFNTRRPPLHDINVRRGLIALFDFEWINRSLYHGLYTRTRSYFDNSELASAGRPASAAERALLAPFPGAVAPDILAGTHRLPSGDGSGRSREARREALALFAAAGYTLDDGRLVGGPDRRPLTLEILVANRDQERLALSYARMLHRVGIAVSVRLVDSAQYEARKQAYDFDIIQYFWFASLSPGNEQAFYWGSSGRDAPGTRNYMGASSEAVDAMISALLAARTRDQFVTAVRALDRVLLSQAYVLPLFHAARQWIARWHHIRHPERHALYGPVPDTWWMRPQ